MPHPSRPPSRPSSPPAPITVANTRLSPCEPPSPSPAWCGTDGAATITATYYAGRRGARTWRCALYLRRERDFGGFHEQLVAEGYGASRDDAERAMNAELAELLGAAVGLRRVA